MRERGACGYGLTDPDDDVEGGIMQYNMSNRRAGAALSYVSAISDGTLKGIDALRMGELRIDRLALPDGGIGGLVAVCHPGMAQ